MKTPVFLVSTFLIIAQPFGLLAIPENKIKEIIEGAESFENLFWAGSTTTLFLTKEKREKFTGWAKAYYKFKDKKTNPSKIRKISKYIEGRPVESIVWKPNGKRCSKTNLKDGKGKEFHWHLNGRKREESNYRNGLANGIFSLWYPNGQLEENGTYVNGNLDGQVFYYKPTGEKLSEALFQDGSPSNGGVVFWLKDIGKVMFTFEDGLKHGPWEKWDNSWKTLSRGVMNKGEPVGPTTYFTYHKNGTKESESDLLKDKYHGNFKKWNPAGKILMEGQFKNGLKDGQWKLFLSTGTKTVIFEKGEIKNSE